MRRPVDQRLRAAASEECGRRRKSGPPVSFKLQFDAIRQGRAIDFEDFAAAKMAFLVKMVVDRSRSVTTNFRRPKPFIALRMNRSVASRSRRLVTNDSSTSPSTTRPTGRPPEVAQFAIDAHENLVEVPSPG